MNNRKAKTKLEGTIAGSYDLEETIGKGHFAVVKLARHVYTGQRVAVKVIDKTKLDAVSKDHLCQEVMCMKLVQHPNVVRLYEVIETQTKLYLILELGDGGDMYDYICKHKHGLSEDIAQSYFRQIVEAVNYCHQLHVVHRDLKLENVVYFKKLGIVKLTDFGLCNKFIPGGKLETSCGSLAYSAPEILLGDLYDAPAVDVWSLGVILFMLVCGEKPFQEANDSETLTMIMDCKYTLPDHISHECQGLIRRMLVREPNDRVELKDIVNHPWVRKGKAPLSGIIPILREDISEKDHNHIVQKMISHKYGTMEDITKSLKEDAYDHITATYYLLAERLIREQQRVRRDSNSSSTSSLKRQTSSDSVDNKPSLTPLALSPRTREKHVHGDIITCICEDPTDHCQCVQSADAASRQRVMSLVSPSSSRPPPPASASPRTPVTPTSPDTAFVDRRCSLIKEESMEEDNDEEDEEMDTGSFGTSHRSRTRHHVRQTKSVEEQISDQDSDSQSRSSSADRLDLLNSGTSPVPPPSSRKSHNPRPIISVRSSPQLLNEICEEAESEEDDMLRALRSKLSPQRINRHTVPSPDLLRKFEHRGAHTHRKRMTGNRGTSCSSSDASDTDEIDPNKKRSKEKLKHRFKRRDSSDHSSDTDTGYNGPPGGAGGGRSLGGSSRGGGHSRGNDDRNKKDKDDENKKKTNSSGSSGSGKQNGSLLGKRDSDSDHAHLDVSRKISNMSLGSNLSNLSLSSLRSSSSKYVIESVDEDSSRKSDDQHNKENTRTRIIHVRSKDFNDLMSRFGGKEESSEDLTYIEKTQSLRNRKKSKDKMKIDINRNGLIAHGDVTMKDEGENQITVQTNTTKCCSVV